MALAVMGGAYEAKLPTMNSEVLGAAISCDCNKANPASKNIVESFADSNRDCSELKGYSARQLELVGQARIAESYIDDKEELVPEGRQVGSDFASKIKNKKIDEIREITCDTKKNAEAFKTANDFCVRQCGKVKTQLKELNTKSNKKVVQKEKSPVSNILSRFGFKRIARPE